MTPLETKGHTFLTGMANCRVVCLGDIMLDRYVYGSVERISPEAPIPVLQATREEAMLGGAGNVARNVTGIGASCVLLGVAGADEDARLLGALAEEAGIALELETLTNRRTTAKWRFVGGHQQLLRADWEDTQPVPSHHLAALFERFSVALEGACAVVLSDYGKGVLTKEFSQRCIVAARRAGLPLVVDPKGTDYTGYRGASVITPNKKELALAAGGRSTESDEEIVAAARLVRDGAGVDAIVATRGPQGMAIIDEHGEPVFRRATAREVYDVSGAGDTVVALLAAALGQGLALTDAVDLANAAAGVVVAKLGTSAVEPAEFLDALSTGTAPTSNAKALSLEALCQLTEQWRARGQAIGFTNGCFDLLHPGHIHLIEQARAQCDRLVVGLNSDASVKRLKGAKRPIYDQTARAILLGSLAAVDAIIIFDEDTPLSIISALVPDVLIKGADYTRESVVGHEIVEAAGGRVFLAELKPGFSTTRTVASLD